MTREGDGRFVIGYQECPECRSISLPIMNGDLAVGMFVVGAPRTGKRIGLDAEAK
jgi:hypothetical protein